MEIAAHNYYFRIGLVHIGRVGSVYVTVAITVERYLSIDQTNPNQHRSWLIRMPILFTIFYNIPRFLELETTVDNYDSDDKTPNQNFMKMQDGNQTDSSLNISESLTNCTNNETNVIQDLGYQATSMRLNPWYIVMYITCSKFIFVQIIPWLTVIILNICIWRKMRKFHDARARMHIIVSGKYILVCNI